MTPSEYHPPAPGRPSEPISAPTPEPAARPASLVRGDLTALIAHRIRAARAHGGWTLVQVAEAIADDNLFDVKLSANQLSKIENGNRDLSIIELAAIAAALGYADATPLMRPGQLCGTCGQELPAATT